MKACSGCGFIHRGEQAGAACITWQARLGTKQQSDAFWALVDAVRAEQTAGAG